MSEESKVKMSLAKRGKYMGEENPRFNTTIYKLINDVTNEFYEGVQYDFIQMYGVSHSHFAG